MKNTKDILKIILADDDQDDRDFFKDAISDIEIDCFLEFCENGIALIDRLNDLVQPVPDIVFLDLNMPMLSGLDTLEKIRKDSKFSRIPIIAIYSTSSDQKDRDRSLLSGADAYITKPSDFGFLKELLRKIFDMDCEQFKKEKTHATFVIN